MYVHGSAIDWKEAHPYQRFLLSLRGSNSRVPARAIYIYYIKLILYVYSSRAYMHTSNIIHFRVFKFAGTSGKIRLNNFENIIMRRDINDNCIVLEPGADRLGGAAPMGARKGLLAPQNTFLDTIAARFDGTRKYTYNFIM